MKYILILSGILAVIAAFLYFMLDNAQNKIVALQGEKTSLQMQIYSSERTINEYNQHILAASKQIAELKEVALESNDTCYNQRISPALLNKLRKSKGSSDTTAGKNN